MARLVVEANQLKRVQAEFADTVRKQPHEAVGTAIRFRGGPFRTQVIWVPSFGFWAYFGLPPSQKPNWNRFWNVFGLGKPGNSVRIVCEINSPFKGINRAIGGAFATDDAGRHLVLHRGSFRFPGMTKADFWRHYGGATTQLQDRGQMCTMALVMTLGSLHAVSDLAKFIREVGRIKAAFR